MHRSRLGAIAIDCHAPTPDEGARFWSEALGLAVGSPTDSEDSRYRSLDATGDDVQVFVQAVDHPSRVHLDIETDDIEAEVRRLERLGATRVAQVKGWWVMEAPTGQRFCVVRPQRPDFETKAHVWTEPG